MEFIGEQNCYCTLYQLTNGMKVSIWCSPKLRFVYSFPFCQFHLGMFTSKIGVRYHLQWRIFLLKKSWSWSKVWIISERNKLIDSSKGQDCLNPHVNAEIAEMVEIVSRFISPNRSFFNHLLEWNQLRSHSWYSIMSEMNKRQDPRIALMWLCA